MQKHAALYCRLSVDDGRFGGSVSIETQKILLEQYCQAHSITEYEFYCDDGYSGTNFQRPAFQRMLSDIHAGKINLVVVKDLSRFGRNYVEVGLQVEHFKEQNVRFIAADDHYDSTVNEDDLMFPMRNVMNEMYARDVSKKTKAAKKAKAKVKNPREEWIIVENCHEPIITQELWDTAHKVMSSKRRPAKTGEFQIFAGLIYCADCGHALTYSQKKRKDGTYHGAYFCLMYKTHGKEYCVSHYIRYDTVYDLVLNNLRTVLWNYRNNTQQFESILEKKFQTDSVKEAKKLQAEYEKKQSRFEEIDKILCKLYEDSALGKIPESRYEAMSAQYESEQREIKEALPDLRQRIEQLKAESDATDKFVNLIKKYTVIDQLAGHINADKIAA